MAVTSDDEIKRQHEEARKIVHSTTGDTIMECMKMMDHGEISLDWKRHPTEADPFYSQVEASSSKSHEEDSTHRPCVSSRGLLDVSKLKALITPGVHTPLSERVKKVVMSSSNNNNKHPSQQLKEMIIQDYDNYWDPIHAAKQNVFITRPSHDAWGIQKIVLKFCDDYLQRTYTLPWYHTTFRPYILPIIHQVCPDEQRVVRLLLAALPPNTTIPVHHDTGAWVQHTHRVHVPILVDDPSLILFRCGPKPSEMQRVSCVEGHVFEINNQAKHAVSNCHPTKYRVHLILDYVDATYQLPTQIDLKRGETLLQTRRTVDPLSEKGSRPTPTYLILGAQKCGTTSLYDYINQHPLVVRARRRETHCLDWRWLHNNNNNTKNSTTIQQQKEHCLKFYFHQELQSHPSLLTGDSTPSYLLDYVRVIPRLQTVFPHLQTFFVMFRDPLQRCYSHYNMVTAQDGTPEQLKVRGTEWINTAFHDVVLDDIQHLKEDGVIPYWDTVTQTVDQQLFDSFIDTKEEELAYEKYVKTRIPLNTGSHSIVSRGLYALQLRPWLQTYDVSKFLILELKQLSNPSIMDIVFDHLQLPRHQITDSKPKNTRSYTKPMSPQTKQLLQRFYQPHNERLQKLLSQHNHQYNNNTHNNPWKTLNPWIYES